MPLVRAAVPADAPVIAGLLEELGYAVSAAEVVERLACHAADPQDLVLVAEHDGRVVGVMALHIARMLHHAVPTARVTTLVTTAAARGTGAGTALLDAAAEAAGRAGCTRVELTTGNARTAAHAFYRARGYEATALAMRKRL
ncbi:MAG TPA: GNAT family N-acetyltransferase [Roseomonas sp.]|jgi:GNAT superfamily N-acetyltransferase